MGKSKHTQKSNPGNVSNPLTTRWLMVCLGFPLLFSVICSIAGCAIRHPAEPLVNAILPVSCIKKPVEMVGCKPDLSKCKKFLIVQVKGCAEVQLVH